MDIRRVTADGVRELSVEHLASSPSDDGVLWVDVPEWDAEAAAVLTERFGIHPRAVEDCARRNPVPKVHAYPGHVFVVLHGPQWDARARPLPGARPVRRPELGDHSARPAQFGGPLDAASPRLVGRAADRERTAAP